MDKFFKIVGIVVVAWLAIGLLGALFGFLAKVVFFVALVAGAVWLVGALANRSKRGERVRR